MEENLNTPGIAQVLERGDVEEVKMILGDREKVRYAGIVRPGIKVPKSTCTDAEKKKYEDLCKEGKDFDEIDRALGGKPRSKTSKLDPKNVDYFTVHPSDFRNPTDAQLLMERYSDPDGKIRRLPVWLPNGELHLVVPHSFRGFRGDGSVRCYSEYESGNLTCHYITTEEIEVSRAEKRKPRFITRPCDRDTCAAYRKRICDFGGLYRVNIPGVRGIGEVIVPTTSWYGIGDVIANLKRVGEVLGRFDGLYNGKPFLELCKVLLDVRLQDGSWQKQWVPTIEPSVDLMELAVYNDPVQAVARACKAINKLSGVQPSLAPTTKQSLQPHRQAEEKLSPPAAGSSQKEEDMNTDAVSSPEEGGADEDELPFVPGAESAQAGERNEPEAVPKDSATDAQINAITRLAEKTDCADEILDLIKGGITKKEAAEIISKIQRGDPSLSKKAA